MDDAYTIGITLALENGVSDGIAAIRRDLVALDQAISASTARLAQLRQAAVGVLSVAGRGAEDVAPVPLVRSVKPRPSGNDTAPAAETVPAPLQAVPVSSAARPDSVSQVAPARDASSAPVPRKGAVATDATPAREGRSEEPAALVVPGPGPVHVTLAAAPAPTMAMPLPPAADRAPEDRPTLAIAPPPPALPVAVSKPEPAAPVTVHAAAPPGLGPVTVHAAAPPSPERERVLPEIVSWPGPAAPPPPAPVPAHSRPVVESLDLLRLGRALTQGAAALPPTRTASVSRAEPSLARPSKPDIPSASSQDSGTGRDTSHDQPGSPAGRWGGDVAEAVTAWRPVSWSPAQERAHIPPLETAVAPRVSDIQGDPGRPAAPPAGEAPSSGPTQGDVYLDGQRVGRWVASFLTREASRPQAGGTGVDPRLGAGWSGATFIS